MKRLYDYDAILADLQRGRHRSQQAVARKHGVSHQLVSKIAVANGLGRGGEDEYALPPGQWVIDLRRRVVVWQEAS